MTITVIQPTRLHGADPVPRGTCFGKLNPDCTNKLHGTYSAYRQGCRCPHAREAARIYNKRLREHRNITRYVSSVGTRRRLRALAAIGWRWQDMAEHLGGTGQNIQNFVVRERGDQVLVTTAARVKVLYSRLSATPGPSEITRKRAIAKGWEPPLAWESVDMDDPDAQPVEDAEDCPEPEGFDPIIVAFAVDGRLTYDQIKDNRADLIETVRRLAQNLGDIEIAHHLRWPGANDGGAGRTRGQNSVCQFRKRNGIAGPEKWEAVYAYTSRDRNRARRRAARRNAKAA